MTNETTFSQIENASREAESLELSAVIVKGDIQYRYKLSTWPRGAWMTEVQEENNSSSSEGSYKEDSESFAEFWRRTIHKSAGGELQLASISARSSCSPLSGKELREVTIAAWCGCWIRWRTVG